MNYLKTIAIFLSIICSNTILAQSPKAQLTGKVIDSLSKEAVYYATISLISVEDTEKINGTIANEKGEFSLENLDLGVYDITISFIGYEPKKHLNYTLKPGKNNLESIVLNISKEALSEIIIQTDKPIIENKIDRLVYNAERDVTSAGGNAIDVLRKVPMLSVDIDGNVSLPGDQGVRILVNGKPSGMMLNNMGDALKMISADQIKSVEVITSPSAKYDAEGASGIINIITKRKDIAGVYGSISGGIGTRHNNGNASVNVRKGKLGVVVNLGGNYMWPQDVTNQFEQFDASGNPTIEQKSKHRTTRSGLRGSLGVDYDLSDKDLFSTTFSTNTFETSKDGFTNSNFLYSNNAINSLISNLDQETKINGFDWSADYTRKFSNPNHELSFSGQFSRNNNDTDYTTVYEEGLRTDELGINSGKNDELTFQVDYSQPIGKTTLEVGAKTILRDISSETDIREFLNGFYQFIDNRSYEFKYNQDVIAGYMTYSFDLSKNYQVKAGVRMEHTILEGEPTVGIEAFNNDYTNLLPSAVISRKLNRTSSLKLSYNQRIQRPSLFYLNPFRDTSNPIVQQQGNPELKPELSHNIELGYSTFIKGAMINASFFYRKTIDVIESLNQIDNTTIPGEPISLTTFENIGTNESFGTNLFVSFSPLKNLTLRSNISLFTYEAKGNSFNNALSSQTDEIYLVYRAFINASYKFDNSITAESFFMVNSSKRTFQGTAPAFSMWTLGIKKEIMDKKASIGLSITDPFSENKNFEWQVNSPSYSQTSKMKLPFRSFGISFSYNFGQSDSKSKTNKQRGIKNDDQKKGESNQGNDIES
ncbi:outer membrane beta-barrel family protein [Myroides guanonis]|uniref:Outer membrane receptor proteins, mostly Fe transport n=1 Tax=Myroides guanonis TaxID=1150112 RepID=A0A1I3QMG1_9FLAO|nr:outer membrane beta-barrel family protein [Myroides guanonis]SFJ34307.1 Outer membrane receptor proteins, mostly Fe transport [Myroides guanonis]